MSTIDSYSFIEKIIVGNGRIDPEDAPDNPWATRIVEYTNAWGKRTWGVTFEREDQDKYLRVSDHVIDPKIIWERKN